MRMTCAPHLNSHFLWATQTAGLPLSVCLPSQPPDCGNNSIIIHCQWRLHCLFYHNSNLWQNGYINEWHQGFFGGSFEAKFGCMTKLSFLSRIMTDLNNWTQTWCHQLIAKHVGGLWAFWREYSEKFSFSYIQWLRFHELIFYFSIFLMTTLVPQIPHRGH